MTDKDDDRIALLKKKGLKVTIPRLRILSLLKEENNQHVTAEELYKILLNNNEEIGLATVYRVLNHFTEVGLVIRHYFESGKSVFELYEEEHHDHLVCLSCNKVVEFHDELIENRQKEIAEEYGMSLLNHRLYLYGKCKSCKKY